MTPLVQLAMLAVLAVLLAVPPLSTPSAEAPTQPGCTLTPEQFDERVTSVRAALIAKVQERVDLEDGYGIRLPNDEETVREVHELIVLERRCCGGFMTFETQLQGSSGPFWLRVRGPGVRALLAPLFQPAEP